MNKIIEFNETIYKLDSKKKLRQLTISTNNGELIQESGLVGGKLITHKRLAKAKNVGRSNETTAQIQAIKEAEAKYQEKLREGYFLSPEEAKSSNVVLPTLAKSYEKEKRKIDWSTAYVQPKFDGMRCLKQKTKLISRKNTVIDTLPHIAEIDLPFHYYLDGELYAHGLNFQENMKLIKKNRPESIKIKYHVYDMVLPNLAFLERFNLLKTCVEHIEHIEVAPTFKVESEEELIEFHTEFIELGYEGAMLRWGNEGYQENTRSSNLLKFKYFKDIACKIVAIGPAKKRPTWARPVVSYDGKEFACSLKLSHAEREEMLINKDKYIGETAEVRFFEYSDNGIPRFPVIVGFRLDK